MNQLTCEKCGRDSFTVEMRNNLLICNHCKYIAGEVELEEDGQVTDFTKERIIN